MSDDLSPIGLPKTASDKQFVRMHRIRKLEQKIIALVGVFFSVSTQEARQETINELRSTNDLLAELESDCE